MGVYGMGERTNLIDLFNLVYRGGNWRMDG